MTSCSGPQLPGPEQLSLAPSPDAPARDVTSQLWFIPAPGSRAELDGTTNVNSWKSRSTDIHGQVLLETDRESLEALFDHIQASGSGPAEAARVRRLDLRLRRAPVATISVPVRSLSSDNGAMDRDMHAALKADAHPAIRYEFQKLLDVNVQPEDANHHPSLSLRVLGTLNMAGATRPVTMDLVVKRDSARHFIAYAQTTLRMTDFGITPPVALLGLVRAADRVHVVFDLHLVLKSVTPAATQPAPG